MEIILKRVGESAGRKFSDGVGELKRYSLRLQSDGGVQIVDVSK
jgi:hypothetical protein